MANSAIGATERGLVPTFVGRQPLFDANLDVRAYQIHHANGIFQADLASSTGSRALWDTFIEIGLDNVAEDQRAVLVAPRDLVLSNCLEIFPADRVALAIDLGREAADAELVEALERLRADGYHVVAERWTDDASRAPFLDVADSVSVDASGDIDRALRLLEKCRVRDLPCTAKNIVTFADFERCRTAGFDLFQGQFLSKPQIVAGGRLPADGITRMRLLAAINDATGDVDELEEIICQDVALSYKLLHYVNSAMFALPHTVESIGHAVMLLGQRWVRTWANMVVMAGVSDKPQAIFNTAVVRGKMCELLGRELDSDRIEGFFTVGLLSALDALMDRPMDEIVADLPLAPKLADALIDRGGEMGSALSCTLAYERSAWDAVGCKGLDAERIRDVYIAALHWAAELRGTLAAA